jgi:hypothetical protein
VLTFDNLFFDDPPMTEEQWGLRNVSIKLPAPGVTAQPWSRTVDLAIDQGATEPTLASYDVHRDTSPDFLVSAANRVGTCTESGELCDLFNPCGAEEGTCQGTAFLGSVFRDDLALLNDETYHYVVRPIDSIGNRGFDSAELAVTPTDAAVTPVGDLRVDTSGSTDVVLIWSNVVTGQGVANYEIYEGTMRNDLTFSGVTTVAPMHTRTGDQSDGLAHYYFVIVVDGGGNRSEHAGNGP